MFADDNFAEIAKTAKQLNIDEEIVPSKEQFVSSSPWAGDTRGNCAYIPYIYCWRLVDIKSQTS